VASSAPASTHRRIGEAAYERCLDRLPADYDGPRYGWGFPGSGSFDHDDVYNEYEYEEYDDEPTPEEAAEWACYDLAEDRIESCLADLVADGTAPSDVIVEYRCSGLFDDLYDLDEQTGEVSDEQWEAADRAYEACLTETGSGVPSGDRAGAGNAGDSDRSGVTIPVGPGG
jgi:hypothetical protein